MNRVEVCDPAPKPVSFSALKPGTLFSIGVCGKPVFLRTDTNSAVLLGTGVVYDAQHFIGSGQVFPAIPGTILHVEAGPL
jgi:hypothetical protein